MGRKILTLLDANPLGVLKAQDLIHAAHDRKGGMRAVLHCAALIALLVASLGAAQDNGPTFRMDVKLVSLFVNVTDKTGAIVGGLTKDDFQVFEDGRPQTIAVFERESELPLNLIL